MLTPLKLATVNIEGNRHFDRLIPFLQSQHADIVCMQEVFAADVPRLERALDLKLTFAPMVLLSQPTPSGVAPRGVWGIATGVCSRLAEQQTVTTQAEYYVGTADQLPHFISPLVTNRVVLLTKVEINNQQVTIANTHFTWTGNGETDDRQRRDIHRLFHILEPIEHLVLCGDFNAPRGGEIYARIAEKYVDCVPADIVTTIDHSVHYSGQQLELVVDAIFSSPNIQVTHVTQAFGVSDHTALTALIALSDGG